MTVLLIGMTIGNGATDAAITNGRRGLVDAGAVG